MTAIDPVCGMEVEESTAEWKTTYKGQTYYFCAPGCLRSFEQEPEAYLSDKGPAGGPEQPHGHEHSADQHHG
jgi:YHS domain-containing protein